MATASENCTTNTTRTIRKCLACGTAEKIGNRQFCSILCRNKLNHTLDIRTGLLQVLNTQYATFHFTDYKIILNILPYGSSEIYSYSYPRTPGKKPVEDYKALSNLLGNYWWKEKKRTRKGYLASRHLLGLAHRNGLPVEAVKPMHIKIPSVKIASLSLLKLTQSMIDSPGFPDKIKQAYRQQAKQNHPDLGGSAAAFRKIHQAYQDLIQWTENPTFKWKQGFPDKWFYSRLTDRWAQPTRHRKWIK